MFDEPLNQLRQQLYNHPVYQKVTSMEALALFMESHVFAVWDFMSLAKRLQHDFTSVQLPWTPKADSRSARFINEIILYEETDKDRAGIPMSHLEMYLAAMREVSADTSRIENVLYAINTGVSYEQALEDAGVPDYVRAFVSDTVQVARDGSQVEAASYFMFGREDAIPEMFTALMKEWQVDENAVPAMTYYLKRHIELDGDEHGPAAESMLRQCIGGDELAEQAALEKAKQAIQSRINFWDGLSAQLDKIPEKASEKVLEKE